MVSRVKVFSGLGCAAAIFGALVIDGIIGGSCPAYFILFFSIILISSVELCRIAGVKSYWSIFICLIFTAFVSASDAIILRNAYFGYIRYTNFGPERFLYIFCCEDNLGVWALLLMALIFPPLLISKLRSRFELRDMIIPVFAVVYLGCLGNYLLRLPEAAKASTKDEIILPVLFLLWFISTAKANDILGYLIGSSIGKHPLSSVSPKKTIEGAVAGLVGGIIVSLLLDHFFLREWFSYTQALIFGIIIGVASQTGDLAESYIKRLCGVKDSGNLIPGSGGALDFIDCFLFAAPVAYYFLLFTL